MFFLGGINSVLPHLIYLSLIWIFLMVGFSGKILETWQIISPQPAYASDDSLQLFDNKVIHYYDIRGVQPEPSPGKTPPPELWTYSPAETTLSHHNIETVLAYEIHYYSSFSFRGPPSFA